MKDYQILLFINALRQCAKEHENDITSTGHIVVSALCRDTVTLLEELKQESTLDKIRAEIKGMLPTYHNPDWSITDLVPISKVLDVVDKYKAEIEPQESEG